jgi:hypothetical protein
MYIMKKFEFSTVVLLGFSFLLSLSKAFYNEGNCDSDDFNPITCHNTSKDFVDDTVSVLSSFQFLPPIFIEPRKLSYSKVWALS